MTDNLPADRPDGAVAPSEPTAMEILQEMGRIGANADALKEIAELAWKEQDRKAVTAFNEALARFHSECGTIKAEDRGNIKTKSGASFSFMYTKLPKLARQVRPVLRDCGLSWSWSTTIIPTAGSEGIITAKCTLRHELGHFVEAESSCPTNDISKSSDAHSWTKAESNAKRRSLMAVLGVTPEDEPDENAPYSAPETITPEEAAELQAWAESVGADMPGFLKYLQVDSLADLPRNRLEKARVGLRKKGKA